MNASVKAVRHVIKTMVPIFTFIEDSKSLGYLVPSTLILLLLPTTCARPLEAATEQTGPVGGIVPPTRAYQAVALGAFGIIMACHRSLMSEGFTNSRSWGTDTFVAMGVIAVAVVWTGGIIASGFLEGGEPCRNDLLLCAGRLIYAPHMLNATIFLWFTYSLSTKFKMSLWTPPAQYTRDAWSTGFKFHVPLVVNCLLTSVILFLAAGAIKARDYTAAVMGIVGCAVYVVRAGGSTCYNNTEVPYRNHNLIRAVLLTSHDAGTVYTTACDGATMQPVWSYVWPNQIEVVNTKLAPALRKLETNQINLRDFHPVLRECGLHVISCTTMDDIHLHMLANWLLIPSPVEDQTKAPGQPFGRELFYYLYIVELFLFVQRSRLRTDVKEKLCKWRVIGRSGAYDIGKEDPYGMRGGRAGLTEALLNVAAIFGKMPQLDFMDVTPENSILPGYNLSHAEGYVGQLWTYCMQGSESIFMALYIFCAIYFMDNGNVHGLRPLAILPDKKDGDVIMHQTMWRQGWHAAIVAQFTSSAVAVIGAVIGGLLI